MSGQDLLMHVDLMARKKWIERGNVEFPFKKGRGEGNIGKRGKGKKKNQSVATKFFSPKSPS